MKNIGAADHPTDFPSQIKSGEHSAMFLAGARLCLELDDYVCNQAGPIDVMRHVAAALRKFGENHPFVTNLATGAVAIAIGKAPIAIHKNWNLIKMTHRLMLDGGYHAVGKALKPAGIILVYIAIHIIVRWTSLILHHRNSRDGGVVIVYPPPYVPILYVPQIWPRGGYSGEVADKVLHAGQKLGQKVKDKVQDRVSAARPKVLRRG
jgi:hypothetical protein